MTSISSTQYSHASPRAMMDNRISAAVSAGTISATDQTALSGALDSIDSSLSASRTSGGKPSGGIKDKIDSLIQDQVKAGSLTADQAQELQNFFAQGPDGTSGASSGDSGDDMAMGGVDGPRGPGGAHHCGGKSGTVSDDSDDAGSTASATDTDSATTQLDTLIAFLEKLRGSMSTSTYGGTGSNTSDSSNSGLLINAMA